MGKVYVKRRANGPPMVDDSQTHMQKRVMASGNDPSNGGQDDVAVSMANNVGYSDPLPGYRGSFSQGAPGPSGILGGARLQSGQGVQIGPAN